MNIITGYTGTPHITSAQDRDGHQGSYGEGSYILDVGSKMAATIVSANEIRIGDGILSHQGCMGNIDKGLYDSVAISSGTQGMKRSDLIVCRYTKESGTNVESMSLVAIEGTPAASNPADPAYNQGNIQSGDSPVDFPLYRVNINGVNVTGVTRVAPYVMTQAEIGTLLGSTAINIGGGTVTGALSILSAKGAVAYTIYDDRVELSPDGPTSIVRAGNICVASCYLKVKKTLEQAQTSLLRITNSTDYPMALVSGIGLNFTKAKVVPVTVSAAGNINFYHGGNIAINDTIVFQITWIAP